MRPANRIAPQHAIPSDPRAEPRLAASERRAHTHGVDKPPMGDGRREGGRSTAGKTLGLPGAGEDLRSPVQMR